MKSKKVLSITYVYVTFALMRQALNMRYISVVDLAKEMSVKFTDLMLFINENNLLFDTCIKKYKGKDLLCILQVFQNESENPKTKLWLENKISNMAKYLFVKEYDNYGQISGYYIQPDESGEHKYELWRNTEKKINDIQKRFGLKEASYGIGGFGDYSVKKKKNGFEISLNQINELKGEGWTFNEFKPI